MIMQFEWDDWKNKINIKKHGIDFSDVCMMFDAPMLIQLDQRQEYYEDRWVGVGMLKSIVVVVVFTDRHEDEEGAIRIISARKATQSERQKYEKEISH